MVHVYYDIDSNGYKTPYVDFAMHGANWTRKATGIYDFEKKAWGIHDDCVDPKNICAVIPHEEFKENFVKDRSYNDLLDASIKSNKVERLKQPPTVAPITKQLRDILDELIIEWHDFSETIGPVTYERTLFGNVNVVCHIHNEFLYYKFRNPDKLECWCKAWSDKPKFMTVGEIIQKAIMF